MKKAFKILQKLAQVSFAIHKDIELIEARLKDAKKIELENKKLRGKLS